jgi:hypothetical protein
VGEESHFIIKYKIFILFKIIQNMEKSLDEIIVEKRHKYRVEKKDTRNISQRKRGPRRQKS